MSDVRQGPGCDCEEIVKTLPSLSLQNHTGQSRRQTPIVSASGGQRYTPCRTFVYPPSNVRDDDLEVNNLPDSTLDLQFVHGFKGRDSSNHLFYLQGGYCKWCNREHPEDEIVFYVAAVAIVMNTIGPKRQSFFHAHNDDITSLAVHPSRQIIATGQVGRVPKICVWDAHSKECFSTLLGFHQRYVNCLDFYGDGDRLISVGGDDQHSVAVYDWRRVTLLATMRGHGSPVLTCRFNLFSNSLSFVSCGENHIKFWDGASYRGQLGLLGQTGSTQNILALAFLDSSRVAAGCADGDIYFFNASSFVGKISRAHTSTTALHWCESEGLTSGGSEGHISTWESDSCSLCQISRSTQPRTNIASELRPCSNCLGRKRSLAEGRRWNLWDASVIPRKSGGKVAGSVGVDGGRCFAVTLDCSCKLGSPCAGRLLVGTRTSEILIVNTRTGQFEALLQGHSGSVLGLSPFPTANLAATCATDGTVRIWDLDSNFLRGFIPVGVPLCSVSVAPDGEKIALGHTGGKISIYSVYDARSILHTNLTNVSHWLPPSPTPSVRSPMKRSVDSPRSPISTMMRSSGKFLSSAEGEGVGEGEGEMAVNISTDDFVSLRQSSTSIASRPSQPKDIIPFAVAHDRVEDISQVRFSPNGRYLAVASRDNFIDIYEVMGYGLQRVGACQGHSSYVTHVDWSLTSDMLQTTDGANELLYWLAPSGRQISKTFDLRNVQWSAQTCALGFCLKSIWMAGSDGTDINTVSVSWGGDLVATADDFGHVNLFRYPAVGERQQYRAFVGHSSHVPNVCFTNRDAYVVSVGGSDLGTFVWRCVKDNPSEGDLEGVDSLVKEELSEDVEAIADHLEDIISLAKKHPQLSVISESCQALLDALH